MPKTNFNRLGLVTAAVALLALSGTAVRAQDAAPPPGPPPGAPHGPETFAALDANKDGSIDKAEFTAPLLKHFDEIDTDHDGKISKAELEAFKAKRHGMDGPPPRGDRDRGDWGRGDWGRDRERDRHDWRRDDRRGPPPFGPERLKELDTNKDGKISFEEFTAPMKAHFDRLDANHDGFIEDSELPKWGDRGEDRHHDGAKKAAAAATPAKKKPVTPATTPPAAK